MGSVCRGAEAAEKPATRGLSTNEVTLRVQSVKVNRGPTELQREFRNNYYSDGNPAVSMQLLLRLENGIMLTPPQDAVAIEMFVDDTYQSLLGAGREGYSSLRNEPPSGFRQGGSYMVALPSVPTEPVSIRVRHFESEATVEVPFKISTGIRL